MTDPFKFELDKSIYMQITRSDYDIFLERYELCEMQLNDTNLSWVFLVDQCNEHEGNWWSPTCVLTPDAVFILEDYFTNATGFETIEKWRESYDADEKESQLECELEEFKQKRRKELGLTE